VLSFYWQFQKHIVSGVTFSFKEKTKQSIILVIRWKTVVTVFCYRQLRDFRRKFKIEN